MIDVLKNILFWNIGNSSRIIQVDNLAFLVGMFIIVLGGVFIIYKKQELDSALRSFLLVKRIAIHLLCIIAIIVRGDYMYSEVQMLTWTSENAIIGIYTIIFSFFRIILFVYVFQFASKIMQYLLNKNLSN